MDSSSIVHLLPEGLVACGSDGRVAVANPAAYRVFEYPAGVLPGLAFESLLDEEERESVRAAIALAVALPSAGRPAPPLYVDGRRSDGASVPIALTISVFPGQPPGAFLALIRDRSGEAERDATARLSMEAVSAAANAIMVTDVAGAIVLVNQAFERLTGWREAEVLGQNPRFLKSGVHGEARYRELWSTLLQGAVWSGETVNRRKDGSLFVEEQTVTPVRDGMGRITHFVAIKQDVTRRRDAEESLSRRVRELSLLHELALGAAEATDEAALREMAVSVAMKHLGTSAFHVVLPGDPAPPRSPGAGEHLFESPIRLGEAELGRLVAVFPHDAPPPPDAGILLGTVAGQLAVALRGVRLMAELSRRAHTDALTGLDNRHRLIERADYEMERAIRYERPLSLVLLDVDHFKRINDTWGHPFGDEVLARLGRLLGGLARSTDTIARWGGEEFALLLPETSLSDALKFAERIRMGTRSLSWSQTDLVCTVSAGVATVISGMRGFGELVAAADRALYRAKQGGRNSVNVASIDTE